MKNTLLTFSKMHGLGNDYVVIDESKKEIIPEHRKPAIVRELCRRGFSIGADGVIFVEPPTIDEADIRFRIFNSDGSEAEMCGNGIRCFAKFVYENSIVPHDEIVVETLGGVKYLNLTIMGEEVISSTVDMGEANFNPDKIPMISPKPDLDEFMDEKLVVDGETLSVSAVNVGNPHAVIFTDKLEDIDLNHLGPLMESHDAFPEKTNVHFVKVVNRGEIEMLTWERGAGFTYACGTGATACSIVGYKLGKLDENVLVHLPGGELFITVYSRNGNLGAFMEGDAVLAFDGVVEIDV